jgi:hypothetical protein
VANNYEIPALRPLSFMAAAALGQTFAALSAPALQEKFGGESRLVILNVAEGGVKSLP